MKRPETTAEAIWRQVAKSKFVHAVERYRGVVFVASIPIGLLLLILLILPKSYPHLEKTHPITDLHHGNARYAVIFDAGSTGSRVHVFKFHASSHGLQLISDTFEQLKPGLSSHADDPHAAAQSLKPLLETALKTVPQELQATTTMSLKATAGLRLLPGDKADKILAAVSEYLKSTPFLLPEGAVGILGGQDEGGFAWLTLNYLLGKLGGGPEETVAAIDLGGGSVQEAFALSDIEAAAAPQGYTTLLKGSGKVYSVYVHSYLGYGLMAGRAKVIETFAANEGHPCFLTGYNSTYKYSGKDYPIYSAALEATSCAKVGADSINTEAECGAAQEECSFNGAWRGKSPSGKPRSYFVSSYFWDRALESGIVTDTKAVSWDVTPKDFGNKASHACGPDMSSLAAVTSAFPAVTAETAPFLCLDLTYCHALLTKGFRLDPAAKVTLVKQVEYNGQSIEAAWPLGAAINDLSA